MSDKKDCVLPQEVLDAWMDYTFLVEYLRSVHKESKSCGPLPTPSQRHFVFGTRPRTYSIAIFEIIRQYYDDADGMPFVNNYWKERCLAAEKCIDVIPCGPDINRDQFEAFDRWNKLKEVDLTI